MKEEILFECRIPGRPIVKKNTQRVYGKGKSRRVVYSPKFLKWRETALKEILNAWNGSLPIDSKVNARMVFGFKNHQSEPDLSNLYEGPQDILQKAGVIKDDKLIFGHDGSTKVFGRGEFTLIQITEVI